MRVKAKAVKGLRRRKGESVRHFMGRMALLALYQHLDRLDVPVQHKKEPDAKPKTDNG